MSVENANSIQKVDFDDSIVACQQDAGDFFDSIGPPLPTWAVHKVVSYLRHWGRAGRAASIAVRDPSPTPTVHRNSRVKVIYAGWREATLLPDYAARRQF